MKSSRRLEIVKMIYFKFKIIYNGTCVRMNIGNNRMFCPCSWMQKYVSISWCITFYRLTELAKTWKYNWHLQKNARILHFCLFNHLPKFSDMCKILVYIWTDNVNALISKLWFKCSMTHDVCANEKFLRLRFGNLG